MIAGLMLVAVLPLCRSAIAQAPATSEKAKKDLQSRRIELESAQKRTTSLETDVSGLKAERERLNVRLVETAALIKTSEAKLTAMEDRLGGLEEQEKLLRGSLNQRHGQIAKLLAALQRMGRNPPPVLITQREDALKMVRSAMMLAAAFPEMRGQALALAGRLTELVRVMTEILDQSQQLKTEMTRLTDARTRLSGLLETKKVSLDERQSELKRMRLAAAEISDSVTDLNELIARLDKAVQTNTGLGAYDAETKRQVQAKAAQGLPAAATPGAGSKSAADSAKQDESKKIAALPPPSSSPNYVELAPGATLMPGSPGRIKPALPFAKTKSRLPMPAQGRQVLTFGEKTQYGGKSKGLVLETRNGAQVTSPCDGWIVYAGEFRSYGQLLIIEHDEGYHVLLAGLGRIDAVVGDLSHGQQRQLEVGMALVTEPELMMLDEPASGLSRGERERLVELLMRLGSEVTLLLIEHDMDVALRVAERVVVLSDGEVVASGTPDEIRADPMVHEIYLGSEADS